MQKLLLAIDKLSTVIGQFFSWLILALTLMISWEVFSRYVLDNRLSEPEGLKEFDYDGYAFVPEVSDAKSWVFRRRES